jgi:hypothetical protein
MVMGMAAQPDCMVVVTVPAMVMVVMILAVMRLRRSLHCHHVALQ